MYNDTPRRSHLVAEPRRPIGSWKADTASAILGQLVGIAPTLIAVRVGLGQSVDNVESFVAAQMRSDQSPLWYRMAATSRDSTGLPKVCFPAAGDDNHGRGSGMIFSVLLVIPGYLPTTVNIELNILNPFPFPLAPSNSLEIDIRKEVGIEDKRQSGPRWSAQSSAPQVGSIKKSRDRG
ncbi:hypothetical protein B0H13DRAFT_1919813 [Mycena leptocephala]|nr:hypothetical protein B0H13DRAFT_1919813 [Mycena leptocephala]